MRKVAFLSTLGVLWVVKIQNFFFPQNIHKIFLYQDNWVVASEVG